MRKYNYNMTPCAKQCSQHDGQTCRALFVGEYRLKHFKSTRASYSCAANLLTQGVSDQRYEENYDVSSYEHPFILFRVQIFPPNVLEKFVVFINMRMRVNFRGVQMLR